MANQFLALALFLMLLSFFIILNALSNFEEVKAKPILNSIAQTFSDREIEDPLAPNVVESTEKEASEGDTLDELQKLFKTHITGVEVSKNRLGTVMHMRMPYSRFESSLLQPSRGTGITQRLGAPGSFFPTLVSLIQTRDDKKPYRMDMVVNIEDRPAQLIIKKEQETRSEMKKISDIAGRMERAGIEKKMISVGLDKGEVGMIDIYISPYIAIDLAKTELDNGR